MIDYSFIIPHKNTPDLLRKCIDSIPHREGVQIIVVDDNSDSEKVDFEHFPGVGEPFTEVYLTKEGRGAGYARNVGLGHAVGKWIVFADADDYFNPCIEQAMEEYLDNEAEVIFFKGNAIKLSDGSRSQRGDIYDEYVEVAMRTRNFDKICQMSAPWRKFFKRKVLQNSGTLFNECRWANDVVFMAKVAVITSLYTASSLPIYCITESSNSLVHASSLESRVVRFEQEREALRILRSKYSTSQLSYWLYFTWHGVYKGSKVKAFLLFPSAVNACGWPFVKEFLTAKFSRRQIRKRIALRWERLREKVKGRKGACLVYPSYWHLMLHGPSKKVNSDKYLTARPNPGAGIGHQISNWHSGYYYSQKFGLRFACCNFSKPAWQTFLGYNEGEVSMDYLLAHGYKKVRLPMFDEFDETAVSRIRRIISSYAGNKVVFILEQDQSYRRQFDVIPFIRKKFYSAPARKKDISLFDSLNYNVALHIRRGDIVIGQTDGNPNLVMRWLGNDYYVKVLDQMLPRITSEKPVQIYLFSQGQENGFLEFLKYPNLHFCLDTNPQQAFLSFTQADMLLTSKSSFSYKPALLNVNGIKVCPQNFWHEYPQTEDWVMVDDEGNVLPVQDN